MVGSTVEALAAFYKERYIDDNGKVPELLLKDNVFLDIIGTSEEGDGTGKYLVAPFVDQRPQGHAATRAAAQAGAATANGGNLNGDAWIIPWGDYKSSVYIGHKAMVLSKNRMGAFFQDRAKETDLLIEGVGTYFESLLLGDEGHSVSPGGFTISTGVCTMVNKQDIVHIEKGMLLQASANNGTLTTDALLGSGSIGYVFAVNRNAGTFTVATSDALAVALTAGTPSGWTGTMFAFRNADFGGTTTPNFIVNTLGEYVPLLDPTDTLSGVDRSLDPMMRGGVRLTAAEVAGLGTRDRIVKLVTRMKSRAGSKPTKILIHDEQWAGLANELEARGIRNLGEPAKAGIFSFPALKMSTTAGMIEVFSSNKVRPDTCWAFKPDAIHFRTASGFPETMAGDGNTILRKSEEDTYELRLVVIPAFYVYNPKEVGRCPLLMTGL